MSGTSGAKFFLIAGLCFYLATTASIAQIVLYSEEQAVNIEGHLYFLEDSQGTLSIEQVSTVSYQAKFQRLQDRIFHHPSTQSAFWLRLDVYNLSHKEAWVELQSSFLGYVDYYTQEGEGYALRLQTGVRRVRAMPSFPSPFFCLPLAAHSQLQRVYIRVATESIVEIPVRVGGLLALMRDAQMHNTALGIFLGVMLVMFGYNLFLYINIRDKAYLGYLGYILSAGFVVSFLNHAPILPNLFVEPYRFWFYDYIYVLLGLPLLFLGHFVFYFLRLTQARPFLRWLIYANVSMIVLGFQIPNLLGIVSIQSLNELYEPASMLFLLSLLSIGIYQWLAAHDKNGLFYALGILWALIGVMIHILCINGWIPHNIFTRGAMMWGIALEVWWFSLALVYRYSHIQKEKEHIQAENLHLITSHNKLLEEKMQERVAKIHRNETLLEQTGKLAQIGAWELDLKTQEVVWSRVTREVHEVAEDYQPTVKRNEIFYNIDNGIQRLWEISKECIKTKQAFDIELRIITAKGKHKWIRMMGEPEFQGDTCVRLYGTFQDIDAQKRAQLEVQAIKDQLTSVFNSISEVVWSVKLPNYEMLLLTPSAVELYEIGFEDFMQDSSHWERAIHPEDRYVIPIIYQALAERGEYYQEYRIITTSGKIKWISNHGQVIYDNTGKPFRLDGLITEITQRKQNEAILHETLVHLRTTQDRLEQQAEEITQLNNHLEATIEARTRQLQRKNAQLNDYAFFNAHQLRAPIATILGLYQVLELGVTGDEREMILYNLKQSVLVLDEMVKRSQSLLDEVEDADDIINPKDEEPEEPTK